MMFGFVMTPYVDLVMFGFGFNIILHLRTIISIGRFRQVFPAPGPSRRLRRVARKHLLGSPRCAPFVQILHPLCGLPVNLYSSGSYSHLTEADEGLRKFDVNINPFWICEVCTGYGPVKTLKLLL